MTIEEILNIKGKEIITKAKANLQRATTHGVRGKRFNSIATGTLYNSLSFDIAGTGDDLELEWSMKQYGYWIDNGRLPTKSSGNGQFEKSLKDWMKVKNIDSKYLYVIKRNIHKNGFRATKFFTKALKEVEKDLDKVIDRYVDDMIAGAMEEGSWGE